MSSTNEIIRSLCACCGEGNDKHVYMIAKDPPKNIVNRDKQVYLYSLLLTYGGIEIKTGILCRRCHDRLMCIEKAVQSFKNKCLSPKKKKEAIKRIIINDEIAKRRAKIFIKSLRSPPKQKKLTQTQRVIKRHRRTRNLKIDHRNPDSDQMNLNSNERFSQNKIQKTNLALSDSKNKMYRPSKFKFGEKNVCSSKIAENREHNKNSSHLHKKQDNIDKDFKKDMKKKDSRQNKKNKVNSNSDKNVIISKTSANKQANHKTKMDSSISRLVDALDLHWNNSSTNLKMSHHKSTHVSKDRSEFSICHKPRLFCNNCSDVRGSQQCLYQGYLFNQSQNLTRILSWQTTSDQFSTISDGSIYFDHRSSSIIPDCLDQDYKTQKQVNSGIEEYEATTDNSNNLFTVNSNSSSGVEADRSNSLTNIDEDSDKSLDKFYLRRTIQSMKSRSYSSVDSNHDREHAKTKMNPPIDLEKSFEQIQNRPTSPISVSVYSNTLSHHKKKEILRLLFLTINKLGIKMIDRCFENKFDCFSIDMENQIDCFKEIQKDVQHYCSNLNVLLCDFISNF